MIIRKIDGSGYVEINYVDAQLKMACEAERKGLKRKPKDHFLRACYPYFHPKETRELLKEMRKWE